MFPTHVSKDDLKQFDEAVEGRVNCTSGHHDWKVVFGLGPTMRFCMREGCDAEEMLDPRSAACDTGDEPGCNQDSAGGRSS